MCVLAQAASRGEVAVRERDTAASKLSLLEEERSKLVSQLTAAELKAREAQKVGLLCVCVCVCVCVYCCVCVCVFCYIHLLIQISSTDNYVLLFIAPFSAVLVSYFYTILSLLVL